MECGKIVSSSVSGTNVKLGICYKSCMVIPKLYPRTKNLSLNKSLYTHFTVAFIIQNSQKPETTQIPIS